MNDSDNIEEKKLLQLLESVDWVLDNEDAEEMLGAEIFSRFSDIRKVIRGWLRKESDLTHEQRVALLADFTTALALQKLMKDRNEASLH